jgi:hypothetical protein
MARISKQKTKKVAFRQRRGVVSKYQKILDATLKLKVGNSIVVDVPRGIKYSVYRNRLSVAIANKVKPVLENDEQYIRLHGTEDNKIAISLIAYEEE